MQAREPSFGVEGGGFIDTPENNTAGSTKSYIREKEKNTQTEVKFNKIDELINMITDQEFINSLKVIGKFAKFLEDNCRTG